MDDAVFVPNDLSGQSLDYTDSAVCEFKRTANDFTDTLNADGTLSINHDGTSGRHWFYWYPTAAVGEVYCLLIDAEVIGDNSGGTINVQVAGAATDGAPFEQLKFKANERDTYVFVTRAANAGQIQFKWGIGPASPDNSSVAYEVKYHAVQVLKLRESDAVLGTSDGAIGKWDLPPCVPTAEQWSPTLNDAAYRTSTYTYGFAQINQSTLTGGNTAECGYYDTETHTKRNTQQTSSHRGLAGTTDSIGSMPVQYEETTEYVELLQAWGKSRGRFVYSLAEGGSRTFDVSNQAIEDVIDFGPDRYAGALSAGVLLIQQGFNNLTTEETPQTAAELIAELERMIGVAHSRKVPVILGTLPAHYEGRNIIDFTRGWVHGWPALNWTEVVAAFHAVNDWIYSRCASDPNVHLFDVYGITWDGLTSNESTKQKEAYKLQANAEGDPDGVHVNQQGSDDLRDALIEVWQGITGWRTATPGFRIFEQIAATGTPDDLTAYGISQQFCFLGHDELWPGGVPSSGPITTDLANVDAVIAAKAVPPAHYVVYMEDSYVKGHGDYIPELRRVLGHLQTNYPGARRLVHGKSPDPNQAYWFDDVFGVSSHQISEWINYENGGCNITHLFVPEVTGFNPTFYEATGDGVDYAPAFAEYLYQHVLLAKAWKDQVHVWLSPQKRGKTGQPLMSYAEMMAMLEAVYWSGDIEAVYIYTDDTLAWNASDPWVQAVSDFAINNGISTSAVGGAMTQAHRIHNARRAVLGR